MPYLRSTQIDKIREDYEHSHASFSRSEVGRLLNEIDRLSDIARTLAEGIRLTHEYIDQTGEKLPTLEGWSWWDALMAYSPEYAEIVKADINRQRELVGLPAR